MTDYSTSRPQIFEPSYEEAVQRFTQAWEEWCTTDKWFDKASGQWYRFETAEPLPEPSLDDFIGLIPSWRDGE